MRVAHSAAHLRRRARACSSSGLGFRVAKGVFESGLEHRVAVDVADHDEGHVVRVCTSGLWKSSSCSREKPRTDSSVPITGSR